MSEYNIQQKQFISAYRNFHKVPVMLNDDAVVEMIKEEMITSGKIYPEFSSLLEGGSSAKSKQNSVFEFGNTQTGFVPERTEQVSQKQKTYLPHEKAAARHYIVSVLKTQIQEAIYGEFGFNAIANPNKISGSEAWQEIEVIGASVVHNLHLGQLGIKEPLNRDSLEKDLNTAYRQIEELEVLVNYPKAFDKKYKEITLGKNLDYSAVIDYLRAVEEHKSAYIQDKFSTLEKLKEPAERCNKTLNIPAVKDFNKWAGRQETGGSLTGLGIDIALAYMSGGMSAASNVAMKTGQGVAKSVTEQAVKTGIKRETAEIAGQAAGITTSQVTGAGLNSAMFQATKIAGALEDGNFTAQELDGIGASYIGLFKFGYVGSAISGPMGAKFGEWAGRLINNEKTVSAIINSSLNKPTTLGKLLTSLSEHTGIIQEATKFGTSFVINTEYMALDEGISFEEALKNLAQMEGVSKIVMAFLGGKTTKFLTPEKVQKITTEIEKCKVEIAVYKGQKAIKVTTPEGKENFFSSHEELIAFVADRVYTEAGVNTGINTEVNTGVNTKVNEKSAKESSVANSSLKRGEENAAALLRPSSARDGEADIHTSITNRENAGSLTVPEGLDLKTVEGQIELAKANGLVERDITPEEAEKLYKKRGFTDADIAEVRKANPNADNWMRTYELFNETGGDLNLDEMPVEEIKEEIIDIVGEKQLDQRIYTFLNETNLKWVQEMYNSPDRVSAIKDLFQMLDELHDNKEDFPKQFRIAKMAHELTGEPFHKLMDSAGNVWNEEQMALLTPERIIAAKKISDTLGREFDLYDAEFIEKPEEITPEFLAEYKSAMEQLEELNVEFNSHTGNPIDYLKDVKEGIELIKKEGLDFSWYQDKNGSAKLPSHKLFVILKEQSKLHNAKVFMDICSDKAKEKYSEIIFKFAFNEGADNPQGISKIFNLLAEYGSKEREYEPQDFINKVGDFGRRENVNWQGVANLLEAYIKNNCVPYRFDATRDMFVENGDFSGAVKLMNELKSFFDGAEEITAGNGSLNVNFFGTFMANSWKHIISDKKVDFKVALKRLEQLKAKNLLDYLSMDNKMLERILTSSDNGIVDKFETVSKKGLKAEYDGTKDYISNSEVTSKDFRDNLELIEKLAKEIDVLDSKVIDADARLTTANSTLTNKQFVDLFARIGDKLSAKDKLWLMSAFSKTADHGIGTYAYFPDLALDILNRMIKEDFSPEDFSLIMKSLTGANVCDLGPSLVDKLVFDPNTRFSRKTAAEILKSIEIPVRKKIAETLCFDRELNFPQEYIADIVKNVNEDRLAFAEELCRNKNFPREHISSILAHTHTDNIDIAKRLCADKDFPKSLIAGIIERTHNSDLCGNNIKLAETLCFDKELNFPKDKIAKILYETKDKNIGLATRLCTDKELNFPVEYIKDILHNANNDVSTNFAEKICTDKELAFPPNKIAELVKAIGGSQKKADFIEKMVYTKDISPDNLKKIANYAVEAKIDEVEQTMNTPEIRQWANKNLDNNLDVEIVINLARTQKKLFAEGKRVQEVLDIQTRKDAARQAQLENQASEIKADPMALDKISSALMELGIPEGMAKNAYAKLCVDSNGNVDYTKLDAAKSLIKACGFYTRINKKGQTAINPNLTPKDITEIFKLATGDKMSAQNGEFRPQIIQDIIALKECGVDDIKLAMNIASVKNMSPIEMKARFKGETRQDIARRIDDIITNPSPQPSPLREEAAPAPYGEGREGVRSKLLERGIDLEAIREKAKMSDKKIDDMKIKEGQGETGKIRSLDSIVGVEKIVLMKFKSEVDQSIWQDEAAFKRWAEEKFADIIDWEKHPEYLAKGRFDAYNQPRREAFEKWVEYLNSEECNVHDDVFSKLLFLDGLAKEMKPDNAYTPPEISHEAFEAVYNQLLEGNTTVSITKAYASFNRTKAIKKYGKETTSQDGITGVWVRIPQGGKRGEPLYDEHIAMIQALSEGSSWCLRFENAHTYLGYGDLHFFLTKQPDGSFVAQTAINVMPNGTIREIEKRYNQDRTVPVPYVQVIKEWKEANGFTGMDYQMTEALEAKPEFDRQKAEFAKLMQNNDFYQIFRNLGSCIPIENADGTIKLEQGYSPFVKGKPYTLFDLGIDENQLMKNVVEISGNMNLNGSALTAAPNLKSIKSIIFGDNKISDLRSLEYINGKPVYWEKTEKN